MHNFYISEFSEKDVKIFIDEVNNADLSGGAVAFLNSYGGSSYTVDIYRDILERYNIELVATGAVYSSALVLFLTTNVPRRIHKGCIGLHHCVRFEDVDITQNMKPLVRNKYLIEAWKAYDGEDEFLCDLLEMTAKERRSYKRDEDVYFSYKRMQSALKNSEEYFANKK